MPRSSHVIEMQANGNMFGGEISSSKIKTENRRRRPSFEYRAFPQNSSFLTHEPSVEKWGRADRKNHRINHTQTFRVARATRQSNITHTFRCCLLHHPSACVIFSGSRHACAWYIVTRTPIRFEQPRLLQAHDQLLDSFTVQYIIMLSLYYICVIVIIVCGCLDLCTGIVVTC